MEPVERAANGRGPLSPDHRQVAELLLGLPNDPELQRIGIEKLGPRQALGALRSVLDWQRVTGRCVSTLHPRLRYRLGPATLILERLVLGTAGLEVSTRLWAWWFRLGRRVTHYIEWQGFDQVTDDVGTSYTMTLPLDGAPGSLTGSMWRPSQRQSSYWEPAPPSEAHRLSFTAASELKISEPSGKTAPLAWPSRVVTVPHITCVVDLSEV